MNLLFTTPVYDTYTRYVSAWSKSLIDLAKKKGGDVVNLKNDKANKDEFNSRMRKLNPDLVVLNGHGDEDYVAGFDNKALVKLGDNENTLKSRITYAVSCTSAKLLGSTVVKGGGSTYIGYDDLFYLVSDLKFINRPLQDLKAQPFMEASNQVVISLLKGNKASDASDRSKDMFKKSYQRLLTSQSDPDLLLIAKCLRWNYVHQVCLGDGEAKIL